MKIGDIIYIVAIILFAWITFGIIRGNFQRKFDKEGNRKDLLDSGPDIEMSLDSDNGKHHNSNNDILDSGDSGSDGGDGGGD